MDRAADVIVVGLGAMGSATAMHLSERGLRTLAFDQFAPPHDRGSSHGQSRIFRQAYFEDARYVPLLMRARELWKRLERNCGERLLHETGALVLGRAGCELVARSEDSARQFDLPHEMLSSAELRKRFPVFAVDDDSIALLEQNAGYLIPETCIEQQLRQAARSGTELHLEEPVLEWRAARSGEGVTVRTARGSYSAEHLVLTGGPWAPRVLAELGLPLRVTRQVLFWFEPTGGVEAFRGLPVYLFEERLQQPLLYGFPLIGADIEGVKVALHGSEEVCTPETICREIRPEDETSIRERLATTLPTLAGRLVKAETCLYTMTPDEHFFLGSHPHHPAVTLAAGFSGHGFKFAQAIGEVLADLASMGKTQFDLGLFSVDRFTAVRTASRG